MTILDSIEIYPELDPSGMYLAIFNFPEQLEKAAVIGSEISLNRKKFANPDNIVLAGMGGSAIGGELASSYLRYELKIPFTVCRNYRLPGYVNRNSLVIISSYSGNTEETISAFEDALARDANIVCITTGGKIAELADKHGCPIVKIPSGLQPRAALGFSVIPILFILKDLGLAKFDETILTDLARGLKAYRGHYVREAGAEQNPAKQLAVKLHGKLPLIYSGPDLFDAVATRWKGQFCENAETLAFHNYFSEFNHNELVGFNKINHFRESLVAVILRDSSDHVRIAKRMSVIAEQLQEKGIEVVNVFSQGDFPLGRIFSLVQLGDFTSFYLAVLNGVDPTPVVPIEDLKKKMAEK